MVRISRVLIAASAAGLLVSGCTVKNTERPALTGPSVLALSLNLTANPDILTQDGSSQSRIVILALDANGQAVRGVPLHLGISVNGVTTLFGLLSNTDIATGSDGRATVLYTAPPLPPTNVDTGTVVTISVIPTSTDYANAVPRLVNIRLVPPAVVTPPPVAAFTFSPATAMPNSPVSFDASTAHADNGIASYTWDFGDHIAGSGMKPQHSYSQEGNYTVTLVVTDTTGRTSYPCTQTVTVATGAAPTASFVFSPTAPGPNQTIFFNASSSTAGNGRKLVDYAWDFGNGTSQRGVTVTTSYSTAGTYNVTLVVTDDAGRTANKSQSVPVTATGASSPTANFVFSPAAPSAGQTVLFNAASSTAGTGRTLTSYTWDFGNGLSGSGMTPSTSYATVGTYNVTLTVRDDSGQTAVRSQSVTVTSSTVALPTPAFVFSPAAPAVGTSIFFDASSSTAASGHSITSYAWTFGDGSTGTGRTYTKTAGYSTAGTYSVMLTVTDDTGQTASRSQSVAVTSSTVAAPTAAFVFSPAAPAAGDSIVFDASTSAAASGHSITSYAWTFGDGTTGTGRTVTKTAGYATAATYTVMLTVTDDLGHASSTSQTVTVGNAVTPTAAFSVSPSPAVVNSQVVVDASTSTTSVGQTISFYDWNFGDSTTIERTTNRTFAHTYRATGKYTITLTITDSAYRTASSTTTLTVGDGSVVANFTFSPSPGAVGVAITFDASTSTGVNPLRYDWTFGDSFSASGPLAIVNHSFATTSIYNVTLTVTDTLTLQSSTISHAVIVQ